MDGRGSILKRACRRLRGVSRVRARPRLRLLNPAPNRASSVDRVMPASCAWRTPNPSTTKLPHSRLSSTGLPNHDEIAYQLSRCAPQRPWNTATKRLNRPKSSRPHTDRDAGRGRGETAHPTNVLYRSAGMASRFRNVRKLQSQARSENRPVRRHAGEVKRSQEAAIVRSQQVSAMQPGMFALSQWHLVGALTLDTVRSLIAIEEGIFRWIRRSVDLLDASATTPVSPLSASEARTCTLRLLQALRRPPPPFAIAVGDITRSYASK